MFRKFLIGSTIVAGTTIATGVAIEYNPTLRKKVISSQSCNRENLYFLLGNNFKRDYLQYNLCIGNWYVHNILKATDTDILVTIAPNLTHNIMLYIPSEKQTTELVNHCVDLRDVRNCAILTDELKTYLDENSCSQGEVNVNCLREYIKIPYRIINLDELRMKDGPLFELWKNDSDEYVMNELIKTQILGNRRYITLLHGKHLVKFLESLKDDELPRFADQITYRILPRELFLKIFKDPFYKLTSVSTNEYHRNKMQYQDGLNVNVESFNNNPNDTCCQGRIYFSNKETIGEFTYLCDGECYIRELTLPREAENIAVEKDKFGTNAVDLKPRRLYRDYLKE